MAIPNWLTISQVSGNGDTIITVTASTMSELTARTESLVISGLTKYVTVPVSQIAAGINATPSTLTASSAASTTTIEIFASDPWSATTVPSFCTVSPTSGASGTTTVTVSVAKNPNYSIRNGNFVFTLDDQVHTAGVSITQEARMVETLYISPTSSSFDYLAGTAQITVTANTDWHATESMSWCSISPVSGGSGTTMVTLNVSPNVSTSNRSGVITFATEDVTSSYTVTQSYDTQTDYLTFDILSAGTITWKRGSSAAVSRVIEYNLNNGGWTSLDSATDPVVNVSAGDVMKFRGNNESYATARQYTHGNSFCGSTAVFDVRGKIMSLRYGDNVGSSRGSLTAGYGAYGLFHGCTGLTHADRLILAENTTTSCYGPLFSDCTSLVSAPELPATTLSYGCYTQMFANTALATAPVLPATTMAQICYQSMFEDCPNLTSAPVLPATDLTNAGACYAGMFAGCTSLTTAPVLPATILEETCYWRMFAGCTSLTSAPVLPATVMKNDCYSSMFEGCTSLTNAPALQSTTLADSCYSWMFEGCTSLTAAPALPATTLADSCYYIMFRNCTSLTTPPVLPATAMTYRCYEYMFDGCTSLTYTPDLPATTLAGGCYYCMFMNCSSLTRTMATLPATTIPTFGTYIDYSPYASMFLNCTSLTTGPELPATSVGVNAYNGMFQGCTSLVTAPALPATSASDNSYANMFYQCSSLASIPYISATTMGSATCKFMFASCTTLTQAPEIQATTVGANCFDSMFRGCTAMTTAPSELSFTTAATSCCYRMFMSCKALTDSPILRATTLSASSYEDMFRACSSLSGITCLATAKTASNCTKNWVLGVATAGTFTRKSGVTWNRGVDACPQNWTIVNYS